MFGLVKEKKLLEVQGDLDVMEYEYHSALASNEALKERLLTRDHQAMMLKMKVDKLLKEGAGEFVEENEILKFQINILNQMIDELEVNNG